MFESLDEFLGSERFGRLSQDWRADQDALGVGAFGELLKLGGLEKFFTPVMGGSILVGILTYSVRLVRLPAVPPTLASAPA